VIYAEGAGEAVGSVTELPPVGEALKPDMLGAAHVLVRRTLVDAKQLEPEEVRFDSPNRTRGRLARGSDLLHATRLRQLLTWPRPQQQPDLAVVLVDADGDRQRATQIRASLGSVGVVAVVAVPVQEFEAWLIADSDAVAAVCGRDDLRGQQLEPEKWERGKAKRRLAEYLSASGTARGGHGRDLRRSVAEQCSLEALHKSCRSYADFHADLRARLP
jgi:hypothetical protein